MAVKKVGVLIREARTAAGLTQEKLAKAAGEGLSAADISKCERGETDLSTAQLKKIAIACGVTQTSLVNAPKNLKENVRTAAKTSGARTEAKSSSKTTAAKTGTKTAAAKTNDGKKTEAKPATAKTGAKTAAAKTTDTKKTEVKPATAKTGAKTAAAKATTAAAKTGAKTTAAKTGAAKTTAKKNETKPAVPTGANTSMKVTATEKKLIEAYREAPAELKKAALKVLRGEYGETVNTLLGASSGAGATAADGIGEMLGGLLGNLLGGK